ncbi:MAG: CDP-alcohol phosphatidyltransferase family protein [Coriobacteriia bacterium]|nr:CDP-alcohol phosphatidyltransferase family protein [Coriobacteriia bacterium]
MVEDGKEMSQHESSGEHERDIWTVANIITVLRLILVPIFFSTLISDRSDVLAFALFAAAASTDWLDGQIARRTGTVTAIGKAIDPLVDRLLIAAGVIGLYIERRLPLWVLILLVARDVYLLYGAWRLEHYHLRMPVSYMGKATTAVLLSGFSLMILNWPTVVVGGREVLVGLFMMYAGIVLSVSTAVQYTFKAKDMIALAGRSDRAG